MGKVKIISAISTLIVLLVTPFANAFQVKAMGTGNPYLDAQTGLTYTIYQPTNTIGLTQTSFKLLKCAKAGDDWLAVAFGSNKKVIEIYESGADQHCSDPGIAKQLADVKINQVIAKTYVYCNPSNQQKFNACSVKVIEKVGGYLMMSMPAKANLKQTRIQIQGTKGVTYQELIKVAKSLTFAQRLPEVFAWDCGMMQSKPQSLTIYCADAGIGVAKISWQNWGGSTTDGTAIYYANNCEPNCAAGKVFQKKVSLRLFNLEKVDINKVYTKLKITANNGLLPLTKKQSITWTLIKTHI